MPSIAETVQKTIVRHGMIRDGEKILVAVSGGPDSVALALVLRGLGYSFEVAHLDHGTREGASAVDCAFVKEFAAGLGVPFHVESRDIAREALAAGQSFETFARDARYAFLARVAEERKCAAIATGHHADDQAETMLMRIVRGTSPRGLAGIPPVRAHGAVRVIRPLIDCRRAELIAYLDAVAVRYRTDESNADTHFVRNRVRHELLPTLESDYNVRIREALGRLAEIQRDENALLEDLAEAFLTQCLTPEGYVLRAAFAKGPPALQRRALTALGWRHGVDCPFDIVESARRAIVAAGAGHEVPLGSGLRLHVTRHVAEILRASVPADASEVVLQIPGETRAFEKRFSVRYRSAPLEDEPARYCTPRRQVFDADALESPVVVRRCHAGDRFIPFGMNGTRKLKDYLSEMGMPVTERNAQLAVTANGTIAWVVGHAIGAHAAITPSTRDLIEIEVNDAVI